MLNGTVIENLREGAWAMNADCESAVAYLNRLDIPAVITDPPYGIDYQSQRKKDRSMWKPKLTNDKNPCYGFFTKYVPASTSCCFVFCRWDVEPIARESLKAGGYKIKSRVIWDREWHGMGDLRASFAPRHDSAWFGVSGPYRFPGKRPHDVLRFKRVAADKLVHPTEKPLDLMIYLINTLTKPGDIVLDPFMGSGTTGIACIKTGRQFIGIEIDKAYYDLAVGRIQSA